MITVTYEQLLYIIALLAGTGGFTYGVTSFIQELLHQRRVKENARKAQEAEYIRVVTEHNDQLRSDLKAAMFRELGYLNERRIAGQRISFLAEMAVDGKKTTVMQR
jgi:hypothetical protein